MNLRTYKDQRINDFSKTVVDYIEKRPLPPGQVAKYRLLNGTAQYNRKTNKTDMIYGSAVAVPLKANIIDPGETIQGEGKEFPKTVNAGIKTMGIVLSIDKQGNPEFKGKMYVYPAINQPEFYLSGSNADDVLMYEALELTSHNKSNPFRDPSVQPIFERINEVEESKKRSTKRNFLKDSFAAIERWTPEEMKAIGAGYNISPSLGIDVIKDRLEQIAEQDPETFYKTIDKESTKIKGLITVAREAGVIHYSAMEKTWYFTVANEVILMTVIREGVDEIQQLAAFLESAANGEKVRGNIEKLIRAKK